MKLSFKILLFSLGFIFIKTSVVAQSSVTFEGQSLISTFMFFDSIGTQDMDYSASVTGGWNLGYRYVSDGGFLLRASLGMRTAGATLVYDNINYSWDFQYADLRVGAGYMYNKGRFQPYINVAPYFAILTTANQTINNENFDIIKSDRISQFDVGLFINPGLQVKISDNISIYAEFNYMMGLLNMEANSNGQRSYNRAYAGTLGVSFTFTELKE